MHHCELGVGRKADAPPVLARRLLLLLLARGGAVCAAQSATLPGLQPEGGDGGWLGTGAAQDAAPRLAPARRFKRRQRRVQAGRAEAPRLTEPSARFSLVGDGMVGRRCSLLPRAVGACGNRLSLPRGRHAGLQLPCQSAARDWGCLARGERGRGAAPVLGGRMQMLACPGSPKQPPSSLRSIGLAPGAAATLRRFPPLPRAQPAPLGQFAGLHATQSLITCCCKRPQRRPATPAS